MSSPPIGQRGLLLSRTFVERFGEQLGRAEAESGAAIERIVMDTEPGGRDLTAAQLERVEAAFFSNDVRYDRDRFTAALHAAPYLRWLHFFAVGLDPARYPQLLSRGVTITNSPGASAPPIALTTLGAILWLGRPFQFWRDAQQRHAWDPIHYDQAPPDLAGQVMVVVGTGEIGARIARYAAAIDLRVIGVQRSPPRPGQPFEEIHPPARLAELLGRAQWLTIACPLTSETRGMIDGRALDLLPRGARLINVARGAIVDHEALVSRLRSGQLGGAFLEALDPEPLPPDSPLWAFPNVLVTPHNAAISPTYPARSTESFLANLVRWGRGEPLAGVIG